jgi:hypothetical protein
MNMNHLHITDLFKRFAGLQQKRLSKHTPKIRFASDKALDQLLSRCRQATDAALFQQVLCDPYFPLGMLERTIFADVTGMRFYINKRRPDLEPELINELTAWASAFLRVRHDIQNFFEPAFR